MALTDKLTNIADEIRRVSGETNKLTLDQMYALLLDFPQIQQGVQEIPMIKDNVLSYLQSASSQYTDTNTATVSVASDYFTSTWDYLDKPTTFPTPQAGGWYVVTDVDSGKCYTINADSEGVLCNLIPEHTVGLTHINLFGLYQFSVVKNTSPIRQIYVDTKARNFRDIGGYPCDGGTVKYGLMFRGSQLDGDFATTETTYTILHDQLGIRSEIDMRESPPQNYSLIGNDVSYYHLSLPDTFGNYHWIVNKDRPENEKQATAILKQFMQSVIDGKPVYLHCTYGADRTGAMFCLIEGLLGVPRVAIDIDYELSNFAYGNKSRTNSLWVGLINKINEYSGDTFRDKIVSWIKHVGEIDQDMLNAFRHVAIDGSPEDITWETQPEYPTNPTVTWVQGKNLNYNDGVTVTDSAQYAYCEFIPIDVNATYTSTGITIQYTNYRVLAYDTDKNFLGVAFANQVNNSSWSVGTKYPNAKYVKFRMYSNNATSVATECKNFVLTKS